MQLEMQIGSSEKKIFYLVINCLIIMGCGGRDYSLNIINNCTQNFDYILSPDSSLVNSIEMCRFLDYSKSPKSLDFEYHTYNLKANSTHRPIGMGENYYKNLLNKSKQKKIYVFIFNEKLKKNIKWPELVKKDINTKRISMTEKQLINSNWHINICK